jgi:glycosyltransferase involved in cell wall biosynthesis
MDSKPLRVTMLTTSFPRFSGDDASIFIRRIVEALSKRNVSGTVIVPLDSRESISESAESFIVKRYRYGLFRQGSLAFGAGIMPNLRANPLLLGQVPLFLCAMAFHGARTARSTDLIHAQWLASGIAAWGIKFFTGKPYVVSLLGEDAKLIQRNLLRPLLGFVLRAAGAVTAVNSEVLEQVRVRFSIPKERCHHISTGVSIPSVSEEQISQAFERYKIPSSAPYLLSIARVIPLKGIHHLLKLMREPALEKMHLVVAGGNDEAAYTAQLDEQAKALGITERVHLIGRVSPSEIPALLHGAKAFISASSYEGRPNAVMESLAAGCLTIVSDISAHRELIRNEENGLVINIDNLSLAAERIHQALEDGPKLERLKRKARESMAENSWEACADALITAYRSCLPL